MANSNAGAERLPALDLMRFFAAAAVVVYHYTYHFSSPSDTSLSLLESFSRHGYLGVELFFMISGFVILWSASNRSARRFVRARALRLYPEFWLSVLLSAAIFLVVPGGFGEDLSLKSLAVNFTMVPQYLGAPYVDGVYWTLGVEIKFYVLVFGLILLNQIRHVETWLLAWIAVFTAASFADVGGVIRSLIIFPYGSFFAAGGLFFLVHESGWSPKRAAAAVICLLLCCYHAVDGMVGFIDSAHITPVARFATIGAIVAMFAVFAAVVGKQIGLQYARGFATVGALTYPLYLLHNTGKEIFFYGFSGLNEAVRVLLAMAFSLALSYAVYRAGTRLVQPALKRFLDTVRLS